MKKILILTFIAGIHFTSGFGQTRTDTLKSILSQLQSLSTSVDSLKGNYAKNIFQFEEFNLFPNKVIIHSAKFDSDTSNLHRNVLELKKQLDKARTTADSNNIKQLMKAANDSIQHMIDSPQKNKLVDLDSININRLDEAMTIRAYLHDSNTVILFESKAIGLQSYSDFGKDTLQAILPSEYTGRYMILQNFLTHHQTNSYVHEDTLFSLLNPKIDSTKTKYFHSYYTKAFDLDKSSFEVNVGANFDFVNGVNPNNLAAKVELFLPDIFSICHSGKRFGFSLGLYENKVVTTDSAGRYDVKYRSYFPDSTMHFNLTEEIGTLRKTVDVRNFAGYGSILFRLGDAKNPNFRSYLESVYEIIKRNYSYTSSYVKDTSRVTLIDEANAASILPIDQVKKQDDPTSYVEEYFSLGVLSTYLDDDFDFSGEVLVGLFSSPRESYRHFNWFYNLTFALSYKNWLSISGEIRHNYFFQSKDTYFVVAASKIIPIGSVVTAVDKLIGFRP
jgi:hypothetical protein